MSALLPPSPVRLNLPFIREKQLCLVESVLQVLLFIGGLFNAALITGVTINRD